MQNVFPRKSQQFAFIEFSDEIFVAIFNFSRKVEMFSRRKGKRRFKTVVSDLNTERVVSFRARLYGGPICSQEAGRPAPVPPAIEWMRLNASSESDLESNISALSQLCRRPYSIQFNWRSALCRNKNKKPWFVNIIVSIIQSLSLL